VAADVTDENFQAKLFAVGFTTKLPTFWLLEGLIMYLDPDPAKALLGKLLKLSAPGSQLACGFMGDPNTKMPEGAPQLPFMSPPEEFGQLVRDLGWKDVRVALFGDPELNFGRYPADRPVDPKQCFCFATQSGKDLAPKAKL